MPANEQFPRNSQDPWFLSRVEKGRIAAKALMNRRGEDFDVEAVLEGLTEREATEMRDQLPSTGYDNQRAVPTRRIIDVAVEELPSTSKLGEYTITPEDERDIDALLAIDDLSTRIISDAQDGVINADGGNIDPLDTVAIARENVRRKFHGLPLLEYGYPRPDRRA